MFCCTLIVFTQSIVYSGSSELELVIVSVMQSNNLAPLTRAFFYHPPTSPYCVLDNLLTACIVCLHRPTMSGKFYLLGDFNNIDITHPLFSKLCLVF